MKSSSGYPENSLTSQNTKMETSTEKQVPLSNRSCNLPSKAVKRVDTFQQTSQPETLSNLGLVSELNLTVTQDTSCQTDFQSEIGRPRYNEANHLISALNKHIQSLEKQLDEKQIIIETLLQNIHNCSYNNIVANSNHKADKVSFENFNSPHEKSKMIFNKSNQVDEDGNHNNNDNQKTIIETKDEQSMTLDKRNDKSSRTPVGDTIPEKETKEQIIESSHHHSDKKIDVMPTEKTKKKTVVIVSDSIVRNVPSRSLNQSLKEYFSVVKSFPGATTQDMKYYIKPTISRKLDMVILHTGTNDLKSNQNPSDIGNEIVNLAKNIKNSGTEVSISALIPRGDRLSEKGKKVNKELQEKCTAENFAFILHKNINSKLDLFPDKLHPNKKGQSILKGNFRKFINEYV